MALTTVSGPDASDGTTRAEGRVTRIVSEISTRPPGSRSRVSTSRTSPTTGPVPSVPSGSPRPPRGAQRLPPGHGRRAVYRSGPRPDDLGRRVRAGHRERAVGRGRRVGVLLRRGPADPRRRWVPLRRRRQRGRPGASRPAAHPRGAAAHQVHAQGGDRRGARMGGRGRTQPARGVRPHPGQLRARPVQADRRRCRQLRRWVRVGVAGPPGGSEAGAARSSSWAAPTRGRRCWRWERSTRWCPMPTWRRWRWSGPGNHRQEPHRPADAEVRLQPARRRPGRAAAVAGEATRLAYGSDEAVEGRDAFLAKRPPDYRRSPGNTEW